MALLRVKSKGLGSNILNYKLVWDFCLFSFSILKKMASSNRQQSYGIIKLKHVKKKLFKLKYIRLNTIIYVCLLCKSRMN